jgi:hypothetical protein
VDMFMLDTICHDDTYDMKTFYLQT